MSDHEIKSQSLSIVYQVKNENNKKVSEMRVVTNRIAISWKLYSICQSCTYNINIMQYYYSTSLRQFIN